MAKFNSSEETMSQNARDRDLVLAPNEYAYILDQTKGHIIAYVGPFKTSMANTDQPVYFDEASKRFVISNMEQSIQTFTTVPEGWYVILKNPPVDGAQPVTGTSNSLTKLNVGRKVNIPGPTFFSLWPGQMVRVVQGHVLRSNQYLLVRVYEEEEAKKNWAKAIIKTQKTTDEDGKSVLSEADSKDLTLGNTFIIKGMNISFYIPPTGIEVVRDGDGDFIREAVTLERLEYCILLDENGNKRFVKGPDVIFPSPTETFYEKNGSRKYKAIELSETSGIYVKVIAPYTDNGKDFHVGQELFITGKEQMIYYPREEHALIKYGDQEIYQAVAIPSGEGRYYLNKETGQVSLQKGPCMFLPDPRQFVIVQRILSTKQALLWYPGNDEVLKHNQKLKQIADESDSESDKAFLRSDGKKLLSGKGVEKNQIVASKEIASDEFVRETEYIKAKTITLDTRYVGAVTINVWTGYSVMVINKSGQRKVIQGPQTYLLEYDEDLAIMELSTGTPKNDEKLIRSAYLRVLHNKVSDIVHVETKDLCPVEIKLSYRINFEGEPEKWFNVENYVKFLTDHLRSVIRNAVQKVSINHFYSNGIDILRDIILGSPDDQGKRSKGRFGENGMWIYDVEILNIKILDNTIEQYLFNAQHEEVKQKMELSSRQNLFEYTRKNEEYKRKIEEEKSTTTLQTYDLKKQEMEKELTVGLTKVNNTFETLSKQLDGDVQVEKKREEINNSILSREKANKELDLELSKQKMEQELAKIKAEVDAVVAKANAVSPDLIAALQAFGDKELAQKMATSMAPLAILGGKSVSDVLAQLLKGTVVEKILQKELPE